MKIPIITIERRFNPQLRQQIEAGIISNEDVVDLFNKYSKIHNENSPYFKKLKKWAFLLVSAILIGGFIAYIMIANTEYEFFDKIIHDNTTLQLVLSYICLIIVCISVVAFLGFSIATFIYSIKARPFKKIFWSTKIC